MSPSPAKAALYTRELDLARRRAQWNTERPYRDMEWKELVRKFVKHSERELAGQAALADLAVHKALAKSRSSSSFSTNPSTSSHSPLQDLSAPPSIREQDRKELEPLLTALETAIGTGQAGEEDRNDARAVLAHGLSSLGKDDDALRVLEGVQGNFSDGYGSSLRAVAKLVTGHAQERRQDSRAAEEAYVAASKAFDEAVDLLQQGGGVTEDSELRAVGEEALYRSSLSSRRSSSSDALRVHQLYLKHSRRWPASFRPSHSNSILVSYRSLLHASVPHPSSSSTSTRDWQSEITAINKAQERLVRANTSLPPAGEINKPYLDFLDDVVDSWRLGGAGREGADEVVDILHNGLTHTFQSQRLLRHLVRVLTARGSHREAAKSLRLYVELWTKSRETDAKQVARDVRKFRARSEKSEKGPVLSEAVVNEEEDFDIDSDADFIRTATFGVRILCKYLGVPEEGLELARKAKAVFDGKKDARLGEDKKLESGLERALGVALGSLAAKEPEEEETRTKRQAEALEHLQSAATLDPDSWETLYHLAYQLFELRQIDLALDQARRAVELNTGSRDCWHLLALLVSAQKEWNAALQVVETALDDEAPSGIQSPDATSAVRTPPQEAEPLPPPIAIAGSNGFLAPMTQKKYSVPTTAATNGTTLDAAALHSALSTQPTSSTPDHLEFPRDETETLLSELAIRVTKNLLVEVLEGAEAALTEQQALFAWFSQAYALIKTETPTEPVQKTSTLAPTAAASTIRHKRTSIIHRRRSQKRPESTNLNGTIRTASPTTQQGSRADTPSGTSYTESGPSGPLASTNPRATKALVDLWLMSAASYRRAGKLDDARGALQEAENLLPKDADLWAQHALYCLAKSDTEGTRSSAMKALVFNLTHVQATIILARIYLVGAATDRTKLPHAEGLLRIAKRDGWDSPEAWFEWSRCYKMMDRPDREKECLVRALRLEETKGVRPLSALPRLL